MHLKHNHVSAIQVDVTTESGSDTLLKHPKEMRIIVTTRGRSQRAKQGIIMPVDALLTTTVELMVIGMGTVFIILGLLIGCRNMLHLLAPLEESSTTCSDDKPVIAAIQTAIHHYRNQSAQKFIA